EGDRRDHAGHDRAVGRRRLRGRPPGPGRPAAARGLGAGGGRTGRGHHRGGAGMTDTTPSSERPGHVIDREVAQQAPPPGRTRRPAWMTFAVYAGLAFITLSIVAEVADAPALTGAGTWGAALRVG